MKSQNLIFFFNLPDLVFFKIVNDKLMTFGPVLPVKESMKLILIIIIIKNKCYNYDLISRSKLFFSRIGKKSFHRCLHAVHFPF